MEELRFHVRGAGIADQLLDDDELRSRLRSRALSPNVELRLSGTDIWLPAQAFATFSADRTIPDLPPLPPSADTVDPVPDAIALLPSPYRGLLLLALSEKGQVFGPTSGAQLRRELAAGRRSKSLACVVGTSMWFRAVDLFSQTELTERDDDSAPSREAAASSLSAMATDPPAPVRKRCPTCLEWIAAVTLCPECGEPTIESAPLSEGRPGSIADDELEASWLRMHWRPLLTMGAIAAMVVVGVALRFLAPGRFYPDSPAATQAPAPTPATCEEPCWTGESCNAGICEWKAPNDVGHVGADPVVAGPFRLGEDASDALLLDDGRFMTALLAGAEIRDARTGERLTLMSEAPHVRTLKRVGDVVYAAGPQHIYVLDTAPAHHRLLKTIELGGHIGDVTLGASGRRALVSLPGAHAVAVLATEYHAEIDRIAFGDDVVRLVVADDSGSRALTTTGTIPATGLAGPTGGAVYAFDPSRLASDQDRVRTSVEGNPVSALITPDGRSGWVVLRERDELVRLSWLPSGAVRSQDRLDACKQPEQIELIRRDRRAVVRCREGRGVELFDLQNAKLLKHVGLPHAAVDMAVAPDGTEVAVAMPGSVHRKGAIALVDTETLQARIIPIAGSPSRISYAPDGQAVLAMSTREKEAWVVR